MNEMCTAFTRMLVSLKIAQFTSSAACLLLRASAGAELDQLFLLPRPRAR